MDRAPNTATLEIFSFTTTLTAFDADGAYHRFNVIPDLPFGQHATASQYQATADEALLLHLGYRRTHDWQDISGVNRDWTARIEPHPRRCVTCVEGCDCEPKQPGCTHYQCWGVVPDEVFRSCEFAQLLQGAAK